MPSVPPLELSNVARRSGILSVRVSTRPGVQREAKASYVKPNVLRIRVSKEEMTTYREKLTQASSVAGSVTSEESLCVACLERPVVSQLLPCMHSPLCPQCLPKGLRTSSPEPLCPLCRQSVTHTKKLSKRKMESRLK
eukprot:TRINITY_DN2022_c17_g1_i1.p1 TRINITY_DN2022_c17_g1~~TRINITY_DN2022_c17_g1_i1.p1  ORF type:complete len:156 (+),score=12.47 TRINITY_DN2022_c17_g1_i1:57-470(+)